MLNFDGFSQSQTHSPATIPSSKHLLEIGLEILVFHLFFLAGVPYHNASSIQRWPAYKGSGLVLESLGPGFQALVGAEVYGYC